MKNLQCIWVGFFCLISSLAGKREKKVGSVCRRPGLTADRPNTQTFFIFGFSWYYHQLYFFSFMLLIVPRTLCKVFLKFFSKMLFHFFGFGLEKSHRLARCCPPPPLIHLIEYNYTFIFYFFLPNYIDFHSLVTKITELKGGNKN
jgi:hypothetical protein